MRAIRDNEEAANAMGKNVVKQHLLIFVLGSAIVGIAGAMMVTYDGLFTPGSYRPMRYTFLIWVMVIVGGSGNNFGAILGGFAVWFLWIEAAPIALFLINFFTSGLEETNAFRVHLVNSIPYFRFLMMGVGLLLIMRYRPKGIFCLKKLNTYKKTSAVFTAEVCKIKFYLCFLFFKFTTLNFFFYEITNVFSNVCKFNCCCSFVINSFSFS